MPQSLSLEGLYVPLITPFTADGDLAPGALEDLAHAVIDDGASGLVALGTTAEAATLTAAERRAVLDACARACRSRGVTLIAGAGSNDTAATIASLRGLAQWPEVSAALTVVPYYTRPSPDGIIAHFTRVAAMSPVPVIVYNVPYRTGVSLGWQALLRLAAVPGIAGMKHAVGGIDHDTVMLMADRPDGFAVLAGDDAMAAPLLALGAAGGILASAHVATRSFARLLAAGAAAPDAEGGHPWRRLAQLSAALFAEPNPAVIKGVLHAQGKIPSPAVRLPLLPARAEAVRSALSLLRDLLAAAGVDALGADQDGGASLSQHDAVVFVEVLMGAARGGEDLPQQQPGPLGVHPRQRVGRAGQLHGPLGGGPLPADPDRHRRPRPCPQVLQLAGAALDDHAHDRITGHRVRKHARVDHRRGDGPVLAQGRHDHQAMVPADQLPELRDIRHGTIQHRPRLSSSPVPPARAART
jgi:4-hydroxy-tetrahydrodipicolinate synthase